MPRGLVRQHRDAGIDVHAAAQHGPVVGLFGREPQGQAAQRATHLDDFNAVRGARGRADHGLNGQAGKVAPEREEGLAAAPVLDVRGKPERSPVSRQVFGVRHMGKDVLAGGADEPLRLHHDDERWNGRRYAASSFRIRRVPSTIAASLATVSSAVRVLRPQSGDT